MIFLEAYTQQRRGTWCEDLTRIFRVHIPPDVQVVCPLTLGNHVDHQITRWAAEQAAKDLDQALLFYADYPYAAQHPEQIIRYQQMGWECVRFDISEEGLEAWFASIAAHRSQISTFWAKDDQMQADIRAYTHLQNGLCLWKPA